jgi:transcriptional regulator with XRE-family HTH domain
MAKKTEKKVVSRLKKRHIYQRTFIREWREHRNLTQEQLADMVGAYLVDRELADGYTHATIGRLENGLVRYTQPVMEAIAEALRTNVASLITRNPLTDPEGMWELWDGAEAKDKAKIVEIAKMVVGKTGTDGN